MKSAPDIHFERIARAIQYLKDNYRNHPSLDELAEYVNLSPFYFQRLFQDWAGVTPKQFLQYLRIEHAKKILSETRSTLSEVAYETGLSGTGRLHDLFVSIEGMTPGEYKNGGQALTICYSFSCTPFGKVLVASTDKGVCYMAFESKDEPATLDNLRMRFPSANYLEKADELQQKALSIFNKDWTKPEQVKLHLKGTEFQLKVWETLLKIPSGSLVSYTDLALQSGFEKAARAVGTAVGQNPVAYLIPCHRVIKSTGEAGNYHWGGERKMAMIGWEAARYGNASSNR